MHAAATAPEPRVKNGRRRESPSARPGRVFRRSRGPAWPASPTSASRSRSRNSRELASRSSKPGKRGLDLECESQVREGQNQRSQHELPRGHSTGREDRRQDRQCAGRVIDVNRPIGKPREDEHPAHQRQEPGDAPRRHRQPRYACGRHESVERHGEVGIRSFSGKIISVARLPQNPFPGQQCGKKQQHFPAVPEGNPLTGTERNRMPRRNPAGQIDRIVQGAKDAPADRGRLSQLAAIEIAFDQLLGRAFDAEIGRRRVLRETRESSPTREKSPKAARPPALRTPSPGRRLSPAQPSAALHCVFRG